MLACYSFYVLLLLHVEYIKAYDLIIYDDITITQPSYNPLLFKRHYIIITQLSCKPTQSNLLLYHLFSINLQPTQILLYFDSSPFRLSIFSPSTNRVLLSQRFYNFKSSIFNGLASLSGKSVQSAYLLSSHLSKQQALIFIVVFAGTISEPVKTSPLKVLKDFH